MALHKIFFWIFAVHTTFFQNAIHFKIIFGAYISGICGREQFFKVGQEMIKNRKKVKNEYYVSEIYNMLLKSNARFEIDIAEEFTPLGTPNDLKKFEEWLWKTKMLEH